MAKVEYAQARYYNSSDSITTVAFNRDILVPIIKCTDSEIDALFRPNWSSDPVVVGVKNDGLWVENMGISLVDIAAPALTTNISIMQQLFAGYGAYLPSVYQIDDGFAANRGSSGVVSPKSFAFMVDYNNVPVLTPNHYGFYGRSGQGSNDCQPMSGGPTFWNSGGNINNYYGTTHPVNMILPTFINNYAYFSGTRALEFYCPIFLYSENYLYMYKILYMSGRNGSGVTTFLAYLNRHAFTTYENTANSWKPIFLMAKGDKTVPKYTLNVVNGSGAGMYNAGDSVTVVAQPPNVGDIFAHWEFSNEVNIQYGGLNTAAVSFLMPSMTVTATAVFISSDSDTYSLTVQNGSGTGIYEENADVTIVANRRENLYFSHWDVSVLGTVEADFSINWTYGGVNTASASFKMPAKNLVIYAAYVNASGDFPYAGGGSSTPSPLTATWNNPENDVTVPDLPNANASAVQAGLVSMFTPTITELQSLGEFLWSDNFITDFADNIKKLLGDPLDCIISLHLVPVLPSHGSTKETVNFGMISSGVDMYRISNQYIEYDCGTLQIENFSGSFMDYSPHTKYQLYLPFIGIEELDADEITGKTLGIKYHIDLLTGSCVAFVSADSTLIASYNGQCSNPVPVSGANYSRTIAALLGVVATGVIAGASMSAGAGAGAIAMAMQNSPVRVGETVAGLAKAFNQTGSIGKGLPGVANIRRQIGAAIDNVMDSDFSTEFANTVSSSARPLILAHAANSAISDIMGAKGMISHSGNMGGSVGFLGKRTPYLITIRPNQSIPNNYGHFFGYPSNLSGQLSTFSGFTSCSAIEAKAISGTDVEMEELIELLKGGVYL